MRNFLSSNLLHFSSCLPTKYNPPEWASTPDLPGGMWRWAASAQHHSWLCTAVPGWLGLGWGKEAGGIIRDVCFIISGGMHVACHYPAFVQLRSDGFHQQRHGGGWPRDVGGARVNHSRATFGAEHHLHPHWNAGEERDIVGNPAWPQVHTSGLFTAYLPLHGDFPFARLSGAHVVKASGVVVGVRATEHQLAPWGMFWISEKSY